MTRARKVGGVKLRIAEIFGPTLQGEGAQIGRPTVFVRLGGCDYRCSWCDTMYAVDPIHKASWVPMPTSEVLDEIDRLAEAPILVTLSGGNPALAPLGPLIMDGHEERGHQFTMETQGSQPRPYMAWLDHLCLSPKPPSSGMHTNHELLAECLQLGRQGRAGIANTILKVVVFDEPDYLYARDIATRHPGVPFFLQAGNTAVAQDAPPSDTLEVVRMLSERAINDRWYGVRILPQLHVLLWGNARAV